ERERYFLVVWKNVRAHNHLCNVTWSEGYDVEVIYSIDKEDGKDASDVADGRSVNIATAEDGNQRADGDEGGERVIEEE
ncbi:hypothetical protein A2U01_0092815, partial [Trifolium medium]|nr:hypothetical protein [Trifolium medium]